MRQHTVNHKKIWALRPNQSAYTFVSTYHKDTEKEIKEHFLLFYPESTFKVQKNRPTI